MDEILPQPPGQDGQKGLKQPQQPHQILVPTTTCTTSINGHAFIIF